MAEKILLTFVRLPRYCNMCIYEIDNDSGTWNVGEKREHAWGYTECVEASPFACPVNIYHCYKENFADYLLQFE